MTLYRSPGRSPEAPIQPVWKPPIFMHLNDPLDDVAAFTRTTSSSYIFLHYPAYLAITSGLSPFLMSSLLILFSITCFLVIITEKNIWSQLLSPRDFHIFDTAPGFRKFPNLNDRRHQLLTIT